MSNGESEVDGLLGVVALGGSRPKGTVGWRKVLVAAGWRSPPIAHHPFRAASQTPRSPLRHCSTAYASSSPSPTAILTEHASPHFRNPPLQFTPRLTTCTEGCWGTGVRGSWAFRVRVRAERPAGRQPPEWGLSRTSGHLRRWRDQITLRSAIHDSGQDRVRAGNTRRRGVRLNIQRRARHAAHCWNGRRRWTDYIIKVSADFSSWSELVSEGSELPYLASAARHGGWGGWAGGRARRRSEGVWDPSVSQGATGSVGEQSTALPRPSVLPQWHITPHLQLSRDRLYPKPNV
jgi:hypothetical protein